MNSFAVLSLCLLALLGATQAYDANLPTMELIDSFTSSAHRYVAKRINHMTRYNPLSATKEALENSLFAPKNSAKRENVFENATPECIAAGEAAAATFDESSECKFSSLDNLHANITRAEEILDVWCASGSDTCVAKARTAIDNLLAECHNLKGEDRRELRKLYDIIGFITNVVCLRDATDNLCFLDFMRLVNDLEALDTITDEVEKLNATAELIDADTCDTCMDIFFKKLTVFQNDYADPNNPVEVQKMREQRVTNVFFKFLCMRHRDDESKFCVHELVDMMSYILNAAAEANSNKRDDFDAADGAVLADLIENIQSLTCSKSVCLKRYAMLTLAVKEINEREDARIARENSEAAAMTKRAVMEDDGEFAEIIFKFTHYCSKKEDGKFCLATHVRELFKMMNDLQEANCVPADGNFIRNCNADDAALKETCRGIAQRFPENVGCCLKKSWFTFFEFDAKADTPREQIQQKRKEAVQLMDALEAQCGATVAEPCQEAQLTSVYNVLGVKVDAWADKLVEFVTSFKVDAATELGTLVNATEGATAVRKKREGEIVVTVTTDIEEGTVVCDELKAGSDINLSATQKDADPEDLQDPLGDVTATQPAPGTCTSVTPEDPFKAVRDEASGAARSVCVSMLAVAVAALALFL